MYNVHTYIRLCLVLVQLCVSGTISDHCICSIWDKLGRAVKYKGVLKIPLLLHRYYIRLLYKIEGGGDTCWEAQNTMSWIFLNWSLSRFRFHTSTVLETPGSPVTARFHRLDANKLVEAKAIFNDWEASGIVRCSSSSWPSPLHLFKKKGGSWQPCSDFRCLNLVT